MGRLSYGFFVGFLFVWYALPDVRRNLHRTFIRIHRNFTINLPEHRIGAPLKKGITTTRPSHRRNPKRILPTRHRTSRPCMEGRLAGGSRGRKNKAWEFPRLGLDFVRLVKTGCMDVCSGSSVLLLALSVFIWVLEDNGKLQTILSMNENE